MHASIDETSLSLRGAEPRQADAAMVLLHGRGARAEDILTLVPQLDRSGFCFVAPQAEGNSWYPLSFLAPLAANEPWLTRSLGVVESVLGFLTGEGIPASRTVILGFSQGACLALEYVARRPQRFGAVAGLTGGLIGPAGSLRDHPGSLAGTPVYLGSGDPDPHVPWTRVEETAASLSAMDGEVVLRRYPGMPHTIVGEQLEIVRELMTSTLAASEPTEGSDDVEEAVL